MKVDNLTAELISVLFEDHDFYVESYTKSYGGIINIGYIKDNDDENPININVTISQQKIHLMGNFGGKYGANFDLNDPESLEQIEEHIKMAQPAAAPTITSTPYIAPTINAPSPYGSWPGYTYTYTYVGSATNTIIGGDVIINSGISTTGGSIQTTSGNSGTIQLSPHQLSPHSHSLTFNNHSHSIPCVRSSTHICGMCA